MAFWRNSRRTELRALRRSDPARLISIFQQCAGLRVRGELPADVSFRSMIEAILDHEERGEHQSSSSDREA